MTRGPDQEEHTVNRRAFLKGLAAAPAIGLLRPADAAADLPKAKITRVRIYRPPNFNPLFNQSNMVVTVETDVGITGIGDGGSKDTLEQCAGTLIGKNPFRIEAIWQEAYIAWFYPPGREKTHALGAMDLALWDIKGKALGLPVHEILGGSVRNYCECYGTTTTAPNRMYGSAHCIQSASSTNTDRIVAQVSVRMPRAVMPSRLSSRPARKHSTITPIARPTMVIARSPVRPEAAIRP